MNRAEQSRLFLELYQIKAEAKRLERAAATDPGAYSRRRHLLRHAARLAQRLDTAENRPPRNKPGQETNLIN